MTVFSGSEAATALRFFRSQPSTDIPQRTTSAVPRKGFPAAPRAITWSGVPSPSCSIAVTNDSVCCMVTHCWVGAPRSRSRRMTGASLMASAVVP